MLPSRGRERTGFLLNRMWILFWCAGIFLISPPSPLPHTTPGSLENLGTFRFDIWAVGKEDSLLFSIRMVKKKKLPFLIFPRMYFVSFLFLKGSCLMDRVRQKSLPCYLTESALSQGIRPGMWSVLCYPEPGFDRSASHHGFSYACQLLLSVLSGLGVQPDIVTGDQVSEHTSEVTEVTDSAELGLSEKVLRTDVMKVMLHHHLASGDGAKAISSKITGDLFLKAPRSVPCTE